ncbi:putative non-heme bromoperoxidase BpoC [Mycolicibacterium insubricum]|uniref:Bromoperoxidase n=1 Tax=Mycolicibacterium insubricum TaxID=444597 RepID=A0A1X0CXW3_9MYCO|nr:bromoperoxidase [Mycolicibacterium insubricum]BBZ65744.1 putative non-heme bromoperoxidase BpoC [Mycolicibacterium insubricum]
MTNLAYHDGGTGDPVLFIAGRGGAGRTWHLHQTPEFRRHGYRVITFDNRGIGATANAEAFDINTMVADTAELIDTLVGGPVRIVAVSMGSYIAQELMLARPELVTQAVLMATRGRPDRMREIGAVAERAMIDSGVKLPVEYEARNRMLENFSPKTLCDDRAASDWFDMFTMWPAENTPGVRAQLHVSPETNRLAAYRAITAEVLVIGFSHDVLLPPALSAEVAAAIPRGSYLEIPDTGHLGFIEAPGPVNAAMLEFFGGPGSLKLV